MWKLIFLYVLLIPGVAMFIHYKHKTGGDTPLAVAWKAACTTLIVLTAIAVTAYAPETLRVYAICVCFGLTFGLVGDITICQKAPGGFLAGMLYFALGHLCYVAAFWRVSKYPAWSIPIFVVVCLLITLAARRIKISFGKLLIPVAVYCAIITAMLSLAVTASFSVRNGWMLLVGAILFAISDAILACGVFKTAKKNWVDTFGLYCYFFGQSLFAISICCLG